MQADPQDVVFCQKSAQTSVVSLTEVVAEFQERRCSGKLQLRSAQAQEFRRGMPAEAVTADQQGQASHDSTWAAWRRSSPAGPGNFANVGDGGRSREHHDGHLHDGNLLLRRWPIVSLAPHRRQRHGSHACCRRSKLVAVQAVALPQAAELP